MDNLRITLCSHDPFYHQFLLLKTLNLNPCHLYYLKVTTAHVKAPLKYHCDIQNYAKNFHKLLARDNFFHRNLYSRELLESFHKIPFLLIRGHRLHFQELPIFLRGFLHLASRIECRLQVQPWSSNCFPQSLELIALNCTAGSIVP